MFQSLTEVLGVYCSIKFLFGVHRVRSEMFLSTKLMG